MEAAMVLPSVLLIILAIVLGIVATAAVVTTLLALIWPSIKGVVWAWFDWLESRFDSD